jgi:hypothetical protein
VRSCFHLPSCGGTNGDDVFPRTSSTNKKIQRSEGNAKTCGVILKIEISHQNKGDEMGEMR